jgi:hypothetical protein
MAFLPSLPLRGKTSQMAISKPPLKISTQPGNSKTPNQANLAEDVRVQNSNLNTKMTNAKTSGYRGKKGGNKVFEESDSSSSDDNDSFASSHNRNHFYDDTRQSPVSFKSDIACTVSTQQLEQPINSVGVFSGKLMLNLSKFHRQYLTDGFELTSEVDIHYQIIYNQLSRMVLKEVRNKIVDVWTFKNFFNYMQDIAYALSIFYAADSILSYKGSDQVRDKNSVNVKYQQEIEGTSSSILYAKDDLRRALKGAWFPPIFSNLIFWMYQTYKTSDLDQACNYRQVPDSCFINTDRDAVDSFPQMYDNIKYATGTLSKPDNVKMSSILSQVMPEGEIWGLPKSSAVATYDQRHYETFCNQPVIYNNGTAEFIFPVAEMLTNQSFLYGMNSNPKTGSGLPFVLQTTYFSGSEKPRIDFFRTFIIEAVYTEDIYKSNKYTTRINASNGKMYFVPRNWFGDINESADVHTVSYRPDDPAPIVATAKSKVASGFQAVYFDNITAPLINLRDFMSSLFNLN